MLKKTIDWAIENGVTIDFKKIDGSVVMVLRKDDICNAVRLIDDTGKINPGVYDFVSHFLSPMIAVIKLEHDRNPEPKTEEKHV